MREGLSDASVSFYRTYAERFAQVSQQDLVHVFPEADHPALRSTKDLTARFTELVPAPARGLDAGCGADARGVRTLVPLGYDVLGIDNVPEVIATARRSYPQLSARLSIADLHQPLAIAEGSLDFVVCASVLQHVEPDVVARAVLPEFARVLRPGGVLFLTFNAGSGAVSIRDPNYGDDGAPRLFQLYRDSEVQAALTKNGLRLIAPDGDKLGGLLHFLDGKRVRHTTGFWRKEAR